MAEYIYEGNYAKREKRRNDLNFFKRLRGDAFLGCVLGIGLFLFLAFLLFIADFVEEIIIFFWFPLFCLIFSVICFCEWLSYRNLCKLLESFDVESANQTYIARCVRIKQKKNSQSLVESYRKNSYSLHRKQRQN